MEGKMKGVLFFVTIQRLVAVDMEKLKLTDISNFRQFLNATDFPLSTLEPRLICFDFLEKGLPLGMCPFVHESESKLYLFGGEKPFGSQGAILDRSAGCKGLCSEVYVSDLTNLHSLTQFTHHSTMICPKLNPVVAEIKGKIYVLSGFPFHYNLDLPSPTFEVYDPSVGAWEALPDPPYYRPNDETQSDCCSVSHAVLGSTLFVHTYGNLYSFSVDEEKWEFLADIRSASENLRVEVCLLPPFAAKFVPGYPDVFISLHGGCLYAGLVSCDGSPSRYQFIDDVTDGCPELGMLLMNELIVPLGEREMCAIITTQGPPISGTFFAVYIITFRVEKLEEPSGPAPKRAKIDPAPKPWHGQDSDDSDDDSSFLSITLLTKSFYNCDAWGLDLPMVTGAFFQPWSAPRYGNGLTL